MRMIFNSFIPAKGFFALDFFGVLFVRRDCYEECREKHPKAIERMINHEAIHTAQMRDFCSFILLGGIAFYVVYFFEWLLNLFRCRFRSREAYRLISFEREAYGNEGNSQYLSTRKRFAQWVVDGS